MKRHFYPSGWARIAGIGKVASVSIHSRSQKWLKGGRQTAKGFGMELAK
jgi:hypothetical protein